jgi:hypothetical protein
MLYDENETAATVQHLTEAAARKYAFCFRRAILIATIATAVSFPFNLSAQAQQSKEGAYAKEPSQELRKDQAQQRTFRALNLDLHRSQQEIVSPPSKLNWQDQQLCETAPSFCPDYYGSNAG